MTTLGFDKPLYILPFDHRGSFQKKMFGWDGALSAQQTAEISAAKRVIYNAFGVGVADGVDFGTSVMLVNDGGVVDSHVRIRDTRCSLCDQRHVDYDQLSVCRDKIV